MNHYLNNKFSEEKMTFRCAQINSAFNLIFLIWISNQEYYVQWVENFGGSWYILLKMLSRYLFYNHKHNISTI